MDTTMQTDRRVEPITPLGATVRQFRLLWLSRRPLLLLIGVVGMLALAGDPWTDNATARLVQMWPVWTLLVGPIWGIAVMNNEGPSNRLYHWSQPVGRGSHTLARLGAGAAWLWLVMILLTLTGVGLAAVEGQAWQLGLIGAAAWTNLFTAPLLGYLAISLLTVASDYPVRWFFGIFFLVPIVTVALVEWLALESAVEFVLQPLIHDTWGLGVALLGAFSSAFVEVQHAIHQLGRADPSASPHGGPFDLSRWWLATALWTVLLTAAVTLVAFLHPDRLPQLRLRR